MTYYLFVVELALDGRPQGGLPLSRKQPRGDSVQFDRPRSDPREPGHGSRVL